jgi:hypothetical protein
MSVMRAVVLLLAALLVLTACSGSGASKATLEAKPNPVPAGSGLGSTTISWKTGDGGQAQVYVSEDGGAENLFDSGTDNGSQEAPWIRSGSTYEFRLYAGTEHKTQLASVKVTRAQ